MHSIKQWLFLLYVFPQDIKTITTEPANKNQNFIKSLKK